MVLVCFMSLSGKVSIRLDLLADAEQLKEEQRALRAVKIAPRVWEEE